MQLELRVKQHPDDLKTERALADVPLDTGKNHWCTLEHVMAKKVDIAQLRCCAEPITLRPNGVFSCCPTCGSGYMLRDGYHDNPKDGTATHMHLFHKIEDVHLLLVYAKGVQQELLKLKIGAPSGSTRGIYAVDGVEGLIEQAHIVCCKTEFAVPANTSATCPDCQTYRYSLGSKKAKTILAWEDVARIQESGKNSSAYHSSTRRFKAGI